MSRLADWYSSDSLTWIVQEIFSILADEIANESNVGGSNAQIRIVQGNSQVGALEAFCIAVLPVNQERGLDVFKSDCNRLI